MPDRPEGIVPLFVLGCPRSGTTLLGKLLASCPSVEDLGEYGGFYLAHYLLPKLFFRRADSPSRDQFTRSIQKHALTFATDRCRESGRACFVDSTPSNVLVARNIAEQCPNARFVLVIRHYAGVVQSLERSFNEGCAWAGANWVDRAALWRSHYGASLLLPKANTVAVSYDQLCSDPKATLSALIDHLVSAGVPEARQMDLSVAAVSHATARDRARPTIAVRNGGKVEFRSISSYAASSWDKDMASQIVPVVEPIWELLWTHYPDACLDVLDE